MKKIINVFLIIVSLFPALAVFLIKQSPNDYVSFLPFRKYVSYFSSDMFLYGIFILIFWFFFCWSSLKIIFCISPDKLIKKNIKDIKLANHEFLPIYIGYFVTALSTPNLVSFLFVFTLISILIFYAKIPYFNPCYFFLKYHFYYLTTKDDVKSLLITKRDIKTLPESDLHNLHKINEATFIEKE